MRLIRAYYHHSVGGGKHYTAFQVAEHVFGPAMPEAFARWAGIAPRGGVAAFDAVETEAGTLPLPGVRRRILVPWGD